MIGLARALLGKRCGSRRPIDGKRCVFDRGHKDRMHGTPTVGGFGYRWWK